MRAFVGVVTCNRPDTLEFVLRFMHIDCRHHVRQQTEVHVIDVGMLPALPVVQEVSRDIRPIGYVRVQPTGHGGSVEECNAELGLARRRLVEEFLAHEEYTHCVILDDDMIVDLNTVYQAVEDYDSIRDLGVGSLTLHPFPKRFQPLRYSYGDKVFITHDFTGDNAWVLPRQTFDQIGNRFGPEQGGYANTTWSALKAAGLKSVTRIQPCYEIQHAGVQGLAETIIYAQSGKKPKWTQVLFRDYLTKRTLHNEVAMLWSSSGIQALLEFARKETKVHEHTEEFRIDGDRQVLKATDTSDVMSMPKGRMEIAVENVRTGEVELIKTDNLVVDNAKKIMARLLGGSAAADWAISKMVFGTGDTTPTDSDVTVEVPITPQKSVTVDYPDDASVRFTSTLESDEANGFPINESALYSDSEGMFARVVFGPLNKTSDFRFVFRHSVYW